MDIFERVKIRLQCGKDFPPEMIKELIMAYESRLAEVSGKLTQRPPDAAGLWDCECDWVNNADNVICVACGTPRR